jgi:hypothetical protein
MALIYLLLFASPQLLVYLYLRERLPALARRWLALVFIVFNIPWLIVGVRMFSGSLWGISRIPYIAPFIAWQFLGWVFCGLVSVYLLGKGAWWLVGKLRGVWGVGRDARRDAPASVPSHTPPATSHAVTRRNSSPAQPMPTPPRVGCPATGSGPRSGCRT